MGKPVRVQISPRAPRNERATLTERGSFSTCSQRLTTAARVPHLDQLEDIGVERLGVDVALDPPHDGAVAADEVCGGEVADRAVEIEDFLVGHAEREIHAQIVSEAPHVVRAVLVDRESDDDQSAIAEALLHLVEVRHAGSTGAAPSGPEVEHDGPALELRGAQNPALERLHRKWRRSLWRTLRPQEPGG